jgi:hypothetical protein
MGVETSATVFAFAAGGNAGNQDMVSRFEGRDAGAHCIDDPDTFVPEDAAGRAGWHVTFQYMQVRAADCRLHHLDDGVSRRLDFRLGTIFERFVPGSMVDKRFHGNVPIR